MLNYRIAKGHDRAEYTKILNLCLIIFKIYVLAGEFGERMHLQCLVVLLIFLASLYHAFRKGSTSTFRTVTAMMTFRTYGFQWNIN